MSLSLLELPDSVKMIHHQFDQYVQRESGVGRDGPLSFAIFGDTRHDISEFVADFCQTVAGKFRFPVYEIDASDFTDPCLLSQFLVTLVGERAEPSVPVGVIYNYDSSHGDWLRYFLVPMHDGETRFGDKTVKLRRCVLAFAKPGGKSADLYSRIDARSPELIGKKFPDFVSRLRFTLDDASPKLLTGGLTADERSDILVRAISATFALEVARDPNFLNTIHWRSLEEMLAEVFRGIGFQATLTQSSKDGGLDIILMCQDQTNSKKYLVEVKHWRSGKRVGDDIIHKFIKVVAREHSDKGLVLSSSGFTTEAVEVVTELTPQTVHLGEETTIVHLCRTYSRTRNGLVLPKNELSQVLFSRTR